MFPHFEERPSDSPFVERIWKTRSEQAGSFTSISTPFWSMVIAKCRGRISISFHGPETGATSKEFPDEAEWFGIAFKLGTFVPNILPGSFIDRYIVLPGISTRAFSLGHSAWQFPTYENADTFVNQLVRAGILVHEPIMNAAHQGDHKRCRHAPFNIVSCVPQAYPKEPFAKSNAPAMPLPCLNKAYPFSIRSTKPDTATNRTSPARSNILSVKRPPKSHQPPSLPCIPPHKLRYYSRLPSSGCATILPSILVGLAIRK